MAQLLLIMTAFVALPTIGKLVRAIVEVIARLVATAITTTIVMLLVVAYLSHGKLI